MASLSAKEKRFGTGIIAFYLTHTAIFWGYPFVWMVMLAFSRWRFVGRPTFVGLANFLRILQDSNFIRIVLNTLNFLAYLIPMLLISSLIFAIALSRMRYFKTFVVMSFLVANVSSGVAYSIMFSNLFAVNGPLNRIVYSLFGFTIPWFSDPQLAVFSICLIVTWKFVGYYGMIIYAGLQAIPSSLFEAAKMDGASNWKIFWTITLPLLNPSLITVTVFATTLTFGIFTEPYMITGGGPMMRTMTLLIYMYNTAFRRIDPSYATVVAIAAAVMSFSLVIVIRRIFEREVALV